MNFRKRAEILSPVMRIIVGFVFLYSGYIKIVEPRDVFYEAVRSYRIFGDWLSYIISAFFPWFEVYLGLFLVLGLFEKYVIRIGIGIFLIFEMLLLQALIRKLDVVNCGCFGAKHSNPIWVEFLLNIVWLFFLFISSRFRTTFSADHFIENKFGR